MGGQVRLDRGGRVQQVEHLGGHQRGERAQGGSQRRVGDRRGEQRDRPHPEHRPGHVGDGHRRAEGGVRAGDGRPRHRGQRLDPEQPGAHREGDRGDHQNGQEHEHGHHGELHHQQAGPPDGPGEQVAQRAGAGLAGHDVAGDHRDGHGQEHRQHQGERCRGTTARPLAGARERRPGHARPSPQARICSAVTAEWSVGREEASHAVLRPPAAGPEGAARRPRPGRGRRPGQAGRTGGPGRPAEGAGRAAAGAVRGRLQQRAGGPAGHGHQRQGRHHPPRHRRPRRRRRRRTRPWRRRRRPTRRRPRPQPPAERAVWRRAVCRATAAGPGRPSPMRTPSAPTTGMTSRTVLVMNASSAATRSSAVNTPSTTR